MRHHILFALAATLFAAACSVEVPVQHAELISTSANMTRTDSCLETECDRAQREWQSSWACTSCISDCVIDGGDYNSCHAYCQYTCVLHCDSTTSPCAESRYSFQASAVRDEAVATACEIAREHDEDCTSSRVATDCDLIGRTRSPAARSLYECRARAACNVTPNCPAPPAGTLGDEWNAALGNLCGSSSTTLRDNLNAAQGLLREDVTSALRGCFAVSNCDDFERCTDAWRGTVGL